MLIQIPTRKIGKSVFLTEIEIQNLKNGKPQVILSGKSKKFATGMKINSIELSIRALCRLGMFIYVNEISDSDGLPSNYYCSVHDYINLFKKFGFFVKDEGFIISEINTQQKWLLFERSL